MPINLAGGYAAGGVHDALLEIVKQRMLEQELAQREEENQFQRLRQNRLDESAASERTYQHGRDTEADKVAAETRTRSQGKDELAAMQGMRFKDLVDPATQGLNEKATPAIGLPPLPGTNVMGVSPPAIRQGKIRTVKIGNVEARPDTYEELEATKDAASQRQIDEARARMVPKAPPEVGTFEDFVTRTYGPNPTSAQLVEARNKWDVNDPQAPRQRYVIQQVTNADGTTGLIRVDMDSGAASSVTLPTGVAGAGKATTAEQRASSAALTAQAAGLSAKAFEADLQDLGPQFAAQLPNLLTTKTGQRYVTAQREWIETVLRPRSGAAIRPDEYDNYAKMYFVQPGDDLGTIQMKQAARARAEESFKVQSGNLQKQNAPGGADKKPGGDTVTVTRGPDGKLIVKR